MQVRRKPQEIRFNRRPCGLPKAGWSDQTVNQYTDSELLIVESAPLSHKYLLRGFLEGDLEAGHMPQTSRRDRQDWLMEVSPRNARVVRKTDLVDHPTLLASREVATRPMDRLADKLHFEGKETTLTVSGGSYRYIRER